MPAQSLTTETDCIDFINGCLFMGTGGGGDGDEGLRILLDALARGLDLCWIDAGAIADEALTVTGYAAGSIAPRTADTDALIASLGLGDPISPELAMVQAVRELARYLGREVGAIVSVELGAGNCPMPLVTGAELGIPVVDGDYSGRAVPDEMQGTPFINGIDSHPFSSVDSWGNVAIVPHTANPYMLERIAKMLSIAGIDGASLATTPLSGADMKRIIVPGTLTQCLEIGRASRAAVDSDADPVVAALEVVDGWRLFDGVVTAKEWEDRDGYMFGSVEIDGTGASSGHTLRVWLKNENHITWLDGEPWICSPDLVTLVDPATARGYTSTLVDVGHAVTAVGMRGLEVFRTSDALRRAFGPEYFGFGDIRYVPIEDLVATAPAVRGRT